MFELFIELVEHATEDDTNGNPLILVDVVIEDKNTQDDCKYLSRCCNQREDVLFKVGNNVVNADLPYNLQQTDKENVPEGHWIVNDECDRGHERSLHKDRKAEAEYKAEEVCTSK